MPATMKDLSLNPNEVETSARRADRLLRDMHKVFSHDLPNQMIALQSLLQFLSQEESSRLSDEGKEYVRRLQNAARRASEMVRFLKEMSRLRTFTCRTESIPLATLARELQGELQRRHPEREFTFEWHWQAPAVVGDPRVFLQAILELCADLLPSYGKQCRVGATSQVKGEAIELAFNLDEPAASRGIADPPAHSPIEPRAAAERMEIILASAWLALCGADVDVARKDGLDASFTIVVPNR